MARVGDTLDRVDAVVGRVEGVLTDVTAVAGGAQALVGRVDQVAERAAEVAEGAAGVVERAGGVADSADQVVERIIPVTGAAEAVLESVGATSAGARALLEIFQPIAERGAPMLRQFVDEFSEEEVQALIRLVDQVPMFTEHMETDIMPILATLDRVGPDVHELLDVLKDVRLAIQGVPGFRMLRRRGGRPRGRARRRARRRLNPADVVTPRHRAVPGAALASTGAGPVGRATSGHSGTVARAVR